MPVFARAPLAFERGEGPWLIARNGDRYLDFGAGVAVNALGHAHPHLVQALRAQSEKLWHVSNLYEIPEGERLAARLVERSFADVAFFVNSGAEALECAIKTARKYHASNGSPERFHVITFEGAFHGRTIATIAAGGQPKYFEGFGPKAPGFDQVPFGDMVALEAAIGPQTAAILIEPIQGEGGMRVAPTETLRRIREICDARSLLMILDEVQTGIGRTGRLFAYERAGIKPDIMALAKGLGGGFPLGVCLATREAAKGMTAGTHGSTFGGNPLAMAVGNAVLDVVLAPGFIERVQALGARLSQRLAELIDRHPGVFEAMRGEGLMMGLKLRRSLPDFVTAAREAGILVVPAGDNVVRLLPPLIIDEAHIGEAFARLDKAAQAIAAKAGEPA